MQPSELAKKFNFCKIGEDGVLEFFCDHSLLSSLRCCEAYFLLQHSENVRHVERAWPLEFGQWLHASLESFYLHEYNKLHKINDPSFVTKDNLPEDYASITKGKFIAVGLQLWDSMKMDEFAGKHKTYDSMKGAIGALKLLSDYYEVYGEGKERLRVIGIELPFGRNKEVPIIEEGSFRQITTEYNGRGYSYTDTPAWLSGPYRAYLTGRLDLLVDDCISIMPFDHKSTAFFSGDESTKFNPQDGMLGYVYAADQLMRTINPDKRVRKMLINHIALADNSSKIDKEKCKGINKAYDYEPSRRFNRTPITYTPEQLAEYRLRQAASFDVLYQLLVLERPAQWNTGVCNSMFYRECQYKTLHANTPSERADLVKKQYSIVESWSPFYESKAEVL